MLVHYQSPNNHLKIKSFLIQMKRAEIRRGSFVLFHYRVSSLGHLQIDHHDYLSNGKLRRRDDT